MTDVNQLVPFEHAQDESAEIFSPASRFREARDHALLREPCLHLEPLPAPSSPFVHALSMFGDDPLHPLIFGDLVKQDAFFPYVIAESYLWGGRENFLQELFPPEQGQGRQIMSPEVEEIENVVEQMTASRVLVMLQHLKIRAPLVIHDHDLAVQNSVKSEFPQRLHNRKELFFERDPVPGIKRNGPVPDLGNGPVPVPFHLEDPIRMIERFLDQGREHRFYSMRHRLDRRILQVYAFHCLVKTDLIGFLLPERFSRSGFEHLLQGLMGHHGTVLLENVPFDRISVFFLQEKPRLPVLSRLYQRELTVQFFSFEDEFHVPFSESVQKKFLADLFIFCGRVMIKAPVPDDNKVSEKL